MMHANEVLIEIATIKQLIRSQFPQWAGLPVRRLQSAGTDNANFRLGDDMLVRLPRIDWAADDVDREQRWLPYLAPHLPVDIPTPIAKGAPDHGYPWHWSIYGWIDGETARLDNISGPHLFARDLAQFLRALRQIDITDAPTASRGVPLAERDTRTRQAIEELRGLIDTQAALAAWKSAVAAPIWTESPVWIHGDLKEDNLLVKEGRLCAVIDFGGAGLGDPACDLQIAWNFLPPDARKVFRAELDADDASWARGKGWALSVSLIALPYYKNSNPTLANIARHAISEILADG